MLVKYIALLRGINISGKNKISMPLLKQGFEDIGFVNVSTYINSGNVLFSSENNDKSEISSQCKAMIQDKFMLDIPVAIISLNELAEALDNAPEWWDINSDVEVIHQAIFLIPPITTEEVYRAVGEARLEYEKVDYFNNVIFWSAPRATLAKTRWYKIASSSVNSRVTIRNASTTKKLFSLKPCELKSENCNPEMLLSHLGMLHTTDLGADRIKKNLCLHTDDVVAWCKEQIKAPSAVITRKGKNWYVVIEDTEITVNAHSYTVITAHSI